MWRCRARGCGAETVGLAEVLEAVDYRVGRVVVAVLCWHVGQGKTSVRG